MTCATCETDIPGSTRFCPQCGSPGTPSPMLTDTRAIDLDDPAHAHRAVPYPQEPSAATGPPTAGTTILTPARSDDGDRRASGDRAKPAARAARERLDGWAERFRSAPIEVRLAVVGAVVTVLSFLLLPYSAGLGQAVELSGRLWWRPIAAVAAAVLLVATLRRPRPAASGDEVPRHTDALLAAVVISTAGVVESGLLGLITGDVVRPRAGFYGMLIGLVVVAVAAVRAARRRLR